MNYSFQRDPSSVSLDLDYNVDRAIKPLPEKENEKITNLLKGILAFKQKLSVEGELDSLHTDVVCFRSDKRVSISPSHFICTGAC